MLGTLVAMATGGETDGVDGAVHFWCAKDVDDLLVQRGVLGRVDHFEALGFA